MTDDENSSSPMGLGMRMCVAGIRQRFSAVCDISTHQLSSLLRDSTTKDGPFYMTKDGSRLLLLDTRPEEEYVVGHIDGSVRVDYTATTKDIIAGVEQLQQQDAPLTVVCYCSVGYRSSIVADKLQTFYRAQGSVGQVNELLKVYNLEGSIFKWANEGRPMVDSNGQPTVYTHPYNSIYGKMLNSELRKSSI